MLESLFGTDPRVEAADELLAEAVPETDPRVRATPTVDDVHEVNDHAETGDPILVPAVSVPLETAERPDMETVYKLVVRVCPALDEAFADDHVRGFDVEFAFGPDRFLRGRTRRRVAVTPDIAARCADPAYDHRALADEVTEEDDGDDVTPPVAWGETKNYTGGGGGGAAAAAAGAGAAGGGGC